MQDLDAYGVQGRQTLVTGGSSGLGYAIARGFARLGARVVINGLNAERLAAAQERLADEGIEVLTSCGDLRTSASAVVTDAECKLGGLDVVIHCASVRDRRGTAALDIPAFASVLEANLTASYAVARAGLPHLQRSDAGRLILVSSLAASMARAGDPAYTASKGGVSALTRSLAAEFASDNLTVNAIEPGFFATEVNQPMVENPEVAEFVKTRVPLKRWGEPDELVSAALFLAMPASSFVNGIVLPVDGGHSAHM